MSKLPQHSGELLALLVNLLRVQSRLTGKKNFERWRTAPLPKLSSKRSWEAQLNLVHDLVGEALPRTLYPSVLGFERDEGVLALTEGVLRALHFFDEAASKLDWFRCLSATIAFALGRLEVRPLQLSHGGVCAQAPAWFFAGHRPEPVRPVVERAADTLGAEANRDPLRKCFNTLRGSSRRTLTRSIPSRRRRRRRSRCSGRFRSCCSSSRRTRYH